MIKAEGQPETLLQASSAWLDYIKSTYWYCPCSRIQVSSVYGIFQAKYWSGLPFPSPGDLPDPGIEPGLPHCIPSFSLFLQRSPSLDRLGMAQRLKRLPTRQETQVQSLGWEDLLEKEMATHSSILAWRIPWTRASSRNTRGFHTELHEGTETP